MSSLEIGIGTVYLLILEGTNTHRNNNILSLSEILES